MASCMRDERPYNKVLSSGEVLEPVSAVLCGHGAEDMAVETLTEDTEGRLEDFGDALADMVRRLGRGCVARKVSGWPKRCKLAHAFLWEYSYKRLQKLAQFLGQLGIFQVGPIPSWPRKSLWSR